MAKVRVYELAKELGVESKTVLGMAKDMGEFVRSASSTLEAPVVRRLKEKIASEPPPVKKSAQKAAAAPSPEPAPTAGSPLRSREPSSSPAPTSPPAPSAAGAEPTGIPAVEVPADGQADGPGERSGRARFGAPPPVGAPSWFVPRAQGPLPDARTDQPLAWTARFASHPPPRARASPAPAATAPSSPPGLPVPSATPYVTPRPVHNPFAPSKAWYSAPEPSCGPDRPGGRGPRRDRGLPDLSETGGVRHAPA